MKKVMVFGTFDIVHEGHKYLLKEAKKHGYLIVVVARDKNVLKFKGNEPKYSENIRLQHVKETQIPDEVTLGFIGNIYKVLEKYKPDIICLGYDQNERSLQEKCKELHINPKIIRLKPFKEKKYKSSLLKKS